MPAATRVNFTVLLDLPATTFIAGALFEQNLAREIVSPSGRTLIRLQFGPLSEDSLFLPGTGFPYGAGTTTRIAILDALTFDGLGFRCQSLNPMTWLIQNTSGLYVEPRLAKRGDVELGESWEGLGAVDLRHLGIARSPVTLIRSLYRCPHLDF